MEESAPKRRRTSPRTSVDIPGASANTTPEPETTTRRKRPSFASPTKASLSRHNPEILERRRSASPQKSPETRPRLVPLRDEPPEDSPSELLAKRLAESVLESDAGRTDEIEPTPSQERQVRRAGGGMASTAKRTPKKPNPRPLPPPGSDEEADINPFRGKTLRRSPTTETRGRVSTSMPPPEIPEPELPPSVPDIISSTPARGIHSSPSRWKEKTRQKPSSPSKKLPVQTSEEFNFPTKSVKNLVQRSKEKTLEPEVRESSTANPRKISAFDPDAEKKKERDDLLKEIEELKKDLEVAQKENERIRVTQQSGRVLAPSDPDQVISLMHRQSNSSNSQPKVYASQILLKAALNPIGLLPFSKPRPIVPPSSRKKEPELDVKSHHPVQMSAKEELPYLQLFSPFSLTSALSVLPQKQDEPLRQLHSITLRSREFPGIFTSRIEMIVNAMDLTILDLKVPALEPVAKAELGAFVEKICTANCNRFMQNNVGVISWAMGEWVRVAVERAAFWSRLEKALGSKDGVLETSGKMRARRPRRKADEEEESEDEEDPLTKTDLIRYLGQQGFEVSIPSDEATPGPSVRFEWKIEFDWTGEAQSKLAVMIGVPGKWHQMDERGSLGKIPKLFTELVDGGEQLETAVKTIVALVAGDVA